MICGIVSVMYGSMVVSSALTNVERSKICLYEVPRLLVLFLEWAWSQPASTCGMMLMLVTSVYSDEPKARGPKFLGVRY